ncbi:hypothetical protein C5167_027628 [Papaver somniferum]|uniref:sulfated surface glycoprotein 185-like n=1 Tax=Papaver somniferum TaxID=3469 RepID=UPI000E6F95EF|nr:sulfated surface glycoprotein 185-like [Papaver somniferum]RZC91569.1 hypothetical protein C5167_027628 [Papaver somniferum]
MEFIQRNFASVGVLLFAIVGVSLLQQMAAQHHHYGSPDPSQCSAIGSTGEACTNKQTVNINIKITYDGCCGCQAPPGPCPSPPSPPPPPSPSPSPPPPSPSPPPPPPAVFVCEEGVDSYSDNYMSDETDCNLCEDDCATTCSRSGTPVINQSCSKEENPSALFCKCCCKGPSTPSSSSVSALGSLLLTEALIQ